MIIIGCRIFSRLEFFFYNAMSPFLRNIFITNETCTVMSQFNEGRGKGTRAFLSESSIVFPAHELFRKFEPPPPPFKTYVYIGPIEINYHRFSNNLTV